MNKYCLLILLGHLIFFGCATAPSPKAAQVQEADQQMVANCKFLGTVTGTSGWGNLAAPIGINNAKNEAKEKAAQLYGTHIVWQSIHGGYTSTVTGNAYYCP